MTRIARKNDDRVISVVFAGVGGQGVILASRLLSAAALRAGLDVKSSEVHGMAQRGGSVLAQVRFGRKVFSPLVPAGEADHLVALEELEALRSAPFLSPGGTVIIVRRRIPPATVLSGAALYPQNAAETLRAAGRRVIAVEPKAIAAAAGDEAFANAFALGALSGLLPFPPKIWEATLAASLPERKRPENLAAFAAGASLANENTIATKTPRH
jgi:indolepyruvate ferredoxin oxidoreductase beta subunit